MILARQAAAGDKLARQKVNALAAPMIKFQNRRFCMRFCGENRIQYQCSLIPPVSNSRADASLCEWGNGGYGWMLDDLTHSRRLLKYEARHGASLFDYLYQIANSLPFYERWKDWRFGRRAYVPAYIRQLSPHAAQVFLCMRGGESIPAIAQKNSLTEEQSESLCRQIIIELTRRKRLYLLNPVSGQSLSSNEEDGAQQDIADHDEDPAVVQQKQFLAKAWSELDAVEQFVLEAMLVDDQEAEDVLAALKKLNLSVRKDLPAEQMNIQQLYYFRRKSLQKLTKKYDEIFQK